MKSLKIWSLIVLFAMAMVGCGNDDEGGNSTSQTDIYGKWHLVTMSSATPEFEVYIEFTNSGKFNIYQQVWSYTYEHFTGDFTVDGDVITGKYSDGSKWTASYKFSVANSKLKLVNEANSGEVSVYEACKIPAEVIEEATTATRAEGVVPFL